MKKKILISLAVICVIWIGYRGYRIATTRSHSPAETIRFRYEDMNINVTYGRPFKKGRVIFGEAKDRPWLPKGKFWTDGFRVLTGLPRTTGALVPFGKYWRLGANDATEISFDKNINFAGKPVNAGRYRTYAIPNRNGWQVCLNSEVGKFGYSEPDHDLDVLKADVPVDSTVAVAEQFTITFNSDSASLKMNFIWDRTLVSIPITILK